MLKNDYPPNFRYDPELLFEKKFVKKRILTIFASPKHMGQSSKRNGLLRS